VGEAMEERKAEKHKMGTGKEREKEYKKSKGSERNGMRGHSEWLRAVAPPGGKGEASPHGWTSKIM